MGIACHTRDSAVAVFGDETACAVREEGFRRAASAGGFPLQSFNSCLQASGITAQDLDYAVFHEKPFLHFARALSGHISSWPNSCGDFLRAMPSWLERRLTLPDYLKKETGFTGKTLFVRHHAAHAAAAYYPSGFERAGVLVMDGGSESVAVSMSVGEGNKLSFLKSASAPHSAAVLFKCGAQYLGLPNGESLMEGLAAYGSPSFEKQLLGTVVKIHEDGALELESSYFSCGAESISFGPKIQQVLGLPPAHGAELEQRHLDIAASIQAVAEKAALSASRALAEIAGSDCLCLGGGLFSNAAINSRVRADGGFNKVFLPTLPGNAGTAAGAALYAKHSLLGVARGNSCRSLRSGAPYPHVQLRRALIGAGLAFKELSKEEMSSWLAERLAAGRLAAWFQGGAEFSALPLASRAVFASPFTLASRQQLNARAKKSEGRRLRACVVRSGAAQDYFEGEAARGFLAPAKREKVQAIPAAAGPDGRGLPLAVKSSENPELDGLLSAFEKRTGVPLLLASSLAFTGEPCILSPEDAVDYFKKGAVDCMALENLAVERESDGKI